MLKKFVFTEIKMSSWFSDLKMEEVCFSETLVTTYKSTWCYYPEDKHVQKGS